MESFLKEGEKLMNSQIPFDPKYADETTYTVEEAEIGDDKTEQKAFMYWTKGEKNHKE